MEQLLFTSREAAHQLGMSMHTVRRAVRNGKLRARLRNARGASAVYGRLVFTKKDLEDYINSPVSSESAPRHPPVIGRDHTPPRRQRRRDRRPEAWEPVIPSAERFI